jgi:hypothetical protein
MTTAFGVINVCPNGIRTRITDVRVNENALLRHF